MSGRIFSEITTIMLALAMAVLVWVAAVREEDPLITKNFETRIPLKIMTPSEELVVLQKDLLPQDIQVEIRAPQSIWQTLSSRKIKAQLDLSNYKSGTHTAPIAVEILDEQATVLEYVPSEVRVEIAPLKTKDLAISVNIADEAPLGYLHRSPTTNPYTVTIKGSEEIVNQVEKVVATIYTNNAKETIEEMFSLTPLNNNDEVVGEVTLSPNRALVTIPIRQRFGYKDVSVKAHVVGQPAPGYWISSISVEPATLTLLGGPSVLSKIAGLVETAEIDVSGATENVVEHVTLNLPPGSSIVADEEQNPENARSVLVTVGISALIGGQTVQVKVSAQGANQQMGWSIFPEQVEVILSGPSPILLNLDENDITLEVDLFDLPAGTHRMQPVIIKPEVVEVISVIPDTVEVTLTRKEATPTPILVTPTITSTVVHTTTDTISTTIKPIQPLSTSLEITATN